MTENMSVAELVASDVVKDENFEVLPIPEVTEADLVDFFLPSPVVAVAAVNLRGKDKWGNMLWKNGRRTESSLMNAAVTSEPRSTAEIAKLSHQSEKRVLSHFAYQIKAGDKIGRALKQTVDGKWFVVE